MKPKLRYVAGGGLALTVLWLSLSFFVFGATGGNIQNVSVEASLNDEMSGEMLPDESGSFSCAGPAPDQYTVDVQGSVYLNTPEGRYVSSATYQLVVEIGENAGAIEMTAVADGTRQVQDILMIPDDESFDPGEEATVTVSLKHEWETVDSVTRNVTVKEQNMNCTGLGG